MRCGACGQNEKAALSAALPTVHDPRGYWAMDGHSLIAPTLCLSSSSLAACLKPPTQSKADWYNFTGANARRSKPDQSEITEPRSLPSLAGATERPSGKPDGLSNYRINSREGCQQRLVGRPQRAARKYADPSSYHGDQLAEIRRGSIHRSGS